MFCAGADIHAIEGVEDAGRGEELAQIGQEVFQLLSELPQRKVAVISGPCVGGGCELVLACDFRLALDIPQTKIGLPEIKLGILPGFGGTQRLPRLVGLPKALDIILKGKVVPAKQARDAGLVDELVKPAPSKEDGFQRLIERGKEIAGGAPAAARRKPPLIDRLLTWTPLGRNMVRRKVRESLWRETRGNYPAPPEALESAVFGLAAGIEAGLKDERRRLGKLIVSPESKALIHVYFATEEAQKLGRGAKEEAAAMRIGVVGAGTMGAGISSAFLAQGFFVSAVETVPQVRERLFPYLQKALSKKRSLGEAERAKLLLNIAIGSELSQLAGCEVVIEAIVEDREKKRELFSALPLSGKNGSKVIIASNTSSLPITGLARDLDRASQIVGMHFFNPVEKMPLVEIIRGRETSDRAVSVTTALTAALGKYPVVVADVPGFLVNKVLTPYLIEASHLLRDGCSIKAIDDAAVRFGFPMGPIRLLDEIGLDVAAKVSSVMHGAYGDRMKGERFLEAQVRRRVLPV
jgi:3-hydroxyacyl-CoA dehydrogenase/enoyl-CoA hydratase/3-hydroxybutyryl-CoA epimerase